MITGVHTMVFTTDAEADRAFFRDVIGLPYVDTGGGWLIFQLPPAEMGVHPAESGSHQINLMCDDIDATIADLGAKGIEVVSGPTSQNWGIEISVRLPGGGELGIYEPRHASPR